VPHFGHFSCAQGTPGLWDIYKKLMSIFVILE